MISWLVQTAFYVPLTFETGMIAGSLSILLSHVSVGIFKLFVKNPEAESSKTLFKCLRSVIRPIHSLEELMRDPNYAGAVNIIFCFCVAAFVFSVLAFYHFLRVRRQADRNVTFAKKTDSLNDSSNDDNSAKKWKAEAQKLLSERQNFVDKIGAVEKLNKRYREAIFQIEQTYNEEHKLKKLEQKRLKNLTKFMEQCSVIVSNRKDKLDDTLKENKNPF